MRGTRLLPLAALLAFAACTASSGDDGASPAPSNGPDGGALLADGAPAPGDDATSATDASTPRGPVRFKIQIDYRYDTAGFFSDPVRKAALEGACRIWGRLLADSFPNVPKGTFIKVRDPQLPTQPALSLDIDYEIDDLLVFVGSAALPSGTTGASSPTAGLSGVTDPTLAAALQQRFDGPTFQPWTAWITFDASTSFHFDPDPELGAPVPAGKLDFVSVALHEIGHVLGFGTADAFKKQITSGAFTGPKARALFGGPLPLTADLAHVPNGTMSGGQRMLMDTSDATGARYLPTPLDQAVLQDLGHSF
ncbi:MAG TPA: hypothetical protein VLT33_42195 [Labilithrix sp.]|nr:hypothetical protein [Labilithrix sp.]